jgi:LysR family nitrogen assimilation transcriptional regulator
MPEPGDSVRAVVARTAHELGLELKVAYEVRSISAMKNLVARGAASSVLPYFSVAEEVKAGALDARPIVTPSLRRTLFLASSARSSPFRNEAGLTGAVRSSLARLVEVLGPLAHPLWVRTD